MSYSTHRLHTSVGYFRLYGNLTLDDVRAMSRDIYAYRAETLAADANAPYYLIADMLDIVKYPRIIRDSRKVWEGPVLPITRYYVVTRNKFFYFVLASVTMIYLPHVQFRLFNDLDAALADLTAHLRTFDPDFPALQLPAPVEHGASDETVEALRVIAKS